MNLHSLFPTTVAEFQLGRPFTEQEFNCAVNAEKIGNVSKNSYVLTELPELKNIQQFVANSVVKYFHHIYRPSDKVSVCLTQSWFNYIDHNQPRYKHRYSNSFLSCVIYFKTSNDKLTFFRDGYEQISVSPTIGNAWVGDSWSLKAVPTYMYLFPSSLSHMIETAENKEARISLAFNTFLTGQLGSREHMTQLQI